MDAPARSPLGATLQRPHGCSFTVWAPLARSVQLCIKGTPDRVVPLALGPRGYHHATVDGVPPGTLYTYRLDNGPERPDPASRYQPLGVHAPSAVVDPSYAWTDQDWHGIPLSAHVIYELHVGTFTPAGTFAEVARHLPHLASLGITAVELMPVAQFPGTRNWGYDGVHPFAPQNSYGGPDGLKFLVNACHKHGLAVILDVVYNHLGPEGNYLAEFGPYFTTRHCTPWGSAINVDGAYSDEVRRYFIDNALEWVTDYHVDGLRLDAIHGIVDTSAYPFLEELADAVHARARELGRSIHVIAESDLNDPRVIGNKETGGWGMDAQWTDDFHHALHTVLTGESNGCYLDFGSMQQLGKAFSHAVVMDGEYSAFRQRRHGRRAPGLPCERFVVCAQNHDQVGNRMLGERLATLVDFESLKLAAGFVLLSPFVPLLFMGEEYGEDRPFLYFTSHSDPGLVEAVREGRRQEFGVFNTTDDPPDPQDPATFTACHPRLGQDLTDRQRALLAWYKKLLALRANHAVLLPSRCGEVDVQVLPDMPVLVVRDRVNHPRSILVFNFATHDVRATVAFAPGPWVLALDSAATEWHGPGSHHPATVTGGDNVQLGLSARSMVLYNHKG